MTKSAGHADPRNLDGSRVQVALVVARFNAEITYAMRDICKKRLLELGVREINIFPIEVPGSAELPYGVQRAFTVGEGLIVRPVIQVAIAIGAVIRGETDHFEHVSRLATDGLLRVSLRHARPVIMGVLTTDTFEQAQDRISHGKAYAENAIEMARLEVPFDEWLGENLRH